LKILDLNVPSNPENTISSIFLQVGKINVTKWGLKILSEFCLNNNKWDKKGKARSGYF